LSEFFQPETLQEALAVLARGPVRVVAGCTDLFPATEAQDLGGPALYVSGVEGLRGISEGPEGWRIGAATTWSDIRDADLPPGFDMLRAAAGEVGSVQIQNVGTIAGNLCNASPAADGVPPLLVLEAVVELASQRGTRQVALADFLTGVRATALQAGEMVTAVLVPRAAAQGRSRFIKLGTRDYLVISIVSVAVRLVETAGRVGDVAIAVGSCSPVAVRLHELESQLAGVALRDLAGAVDAGLVAGALSPLSDVRGTSDYRVEAATELVRRTLADLSGSEGAR